MNSSYVTVNKEVNKLLTPKFMIVTIHQVVVTIQNRVVRWGG